MQTTFKKGHKFDILDMFTISQSEVQELFWKEFESNLNKKKPNLDNLKVMLESGLVDLEAKDEDSYTPLHWAAMRNSLEVAKLLFKHSSKKNRENVLNRYRNVYGHKTLVKSLEKLKV